jgi:hypothetical protein
MATKTNFLDTYNLMADFEVVLEDNLFILQKLGLTLHDVVCLVGGVPCSAVTNTKVFIETHLNDTINVHILTSEYELKRLIDFGDMTIDNELMKVKARGNGLGLYLFLNQVETAKEHGFKQINLYAMGGSDWGFDPGWNGYYTWGRVGFLMEQNSYERFRGWVYDSHSGMLYLHEVLDTDWGQNAWKQSGFSWDGYFDLNERSLSLQYSGSFLT